MTLRPAALALLASLVSLTVGSAAHAAEGWPTADVKGSADHPVISRFTGSLLVGYAQQDWAAVQQPSAAGLSKTERNKFADPISAEGKVTRLFYLGPAGKTPLEIFRNQQQALMAAGFKPRFSCELKSCEPVYFALDTDTRGQGMNWSPGALIGVKGSNFQGARWALPMSLSTDEARMTVGTLSRGGSTVQLLVYTSIAENEYTDRAASYIEIVEPKAMPTGQVTVDAKAISAGLQAEGKVALYGVLFDTGKTELKPDSNAQLDQMAAVLKAQPAAKVFIVGHTDNVGAVDANLKLSQGRAQAVVAALTQRGIAASRLAAHGNAGYAPVASNASEDGRAKNRRVEMVLQ
ncbi:OmpA family protein [Pelomonas baiyunensis]|uniref:OmpA family protein n=1 Tax=Pelomonas baiyunensis TaxID=3299026 RepID=A0ABW7GYV1_9BURK